MGRPTWPNPVSRGPTGPARSMSGRRSSPGSAPRPRTRSPHSVAHLLDLDLDVVFVDTTSTYSEVESADELADLRDDAGDDEVTNRPRPADERSRTQGSPRRPAAGGHSYGGDRPRDRRAAGPSAETPPTPRSSARSKTACPTEARAVRVGGRPRLRLRGRPRLPDPRRRGLHHGEKLQA